MPVQWRYFSLSTKSTNVKLQTAYLNRLLSNTRFRFNLNVKYKPNMRIWIFNTNKLGKPVQHSEYTGYSISTGFVICWSKKERKPWVFYKELTAPNIINKIQIKIISKLSQKAKCYRQIFLRTHTSTYLLSNMLTIHSRCEKTDVTFQRCFKCQHDDTDALGLVPENPGLNHVARKNNRIFHENLGTKSV